MSPWDSIYQEYCRQHLDADGDFSMEFKDWLKLNYYPPMKKLRTVINKALGDIPYDERIRRKDLE